MSEFRREFREAQREAYWTLPRVVVGIVVVFVVLGIVFWLLALMAQPARLVSKTFDADNIIANYEFFHDANNQVTARVGQIRSHKAIIADNTDAGERPRLRIELAAIQQSCRDLVGRYNANAAKVNRSIFRGGSAPESINPSTCE